MRLSAADCKDIMVSVALPPIPPGLWSAANPGFGKGDNAERAKREPKRASGGGDTSGV